MNNALRKNIYPLTISCCILVLHFVNNAFTTYGIFRDELYYIACSEHLSWGFVDQPPLCALLLFLQRSVFGDSIFAIRLLPSFAHALTVFLTGVLVRKLHGNNLSEILAMFCAAFAPGLMGMFGFYSMNAVEIVLWQLVFYFILLLQETNKAKYWYIIGILLGIGLMNKISTSWLGAGIGVALLFTNQRKCLSTKYPWLAAAITGILFLPFILWNIHNDFAHLEFMRRAASLKYASQNIGTFFSGLFMNNNPFASLVWVTGYIGLLFGKRKNRVIGAIILTIFFFLIINVHSKAEYFNPAMPILFAYGAIILTEWIFSHQRMKIIGAAYLVILSITGIMTVPLAIDFFPVHTFIKYARVLKLGSETTEGHRMRELPQHFADRFGWKELADDVGNVFSSLNPAEQKSCIIYAGNYGEAGAIDFYGEKYGMPKAFSGHNTYYLWGKERLEDSISVMIAIGGEMSDYADIFDEIKQVAVHTSEFSMLYETNLPIFVCGKPKVKIKDVWYRMKNYI